MRTNDCIPGRDDTLIALLNTAVEQARCLNRSFTAEEALGSIWDAGFDVSPQCDTRFVLHSENPRLWTITQTPQAWQDVPVCQVPARVVVARPTNIRI